MDHTFFLHLSCLLYYIHTYIHKTGSCNKHYKMRLVSVCHLTDIMSINQHLSDTKICYCTDNNTGRTKEQWLKIQILPLLKRKTPSW